MISKKDVKSTWHMMDCLLLLGAFCLTFNSLHWHHLFWYNPTRFWPLMAWPLFTFTLTILSLFIHYGVVCSSVDGSRRTTTMLLPLFPPKNTSRRAEISRRQLLNSPANARMSLHDDLLINGFEFVPIPYNFNSHVYLHVHME